MSQVTAGNRIDTFQFQIQAQAQAQAQATEGTEGTETFHPSAQALPSTPRQTPRYHAYLLSPEWRELRRQVRTRCQNVCESCGLASVEAVHHKTYVRLGAERLSDLLGICDACHKKLHGIKNLHVIPLVFGGTLT